MRRYHGTPHDIYVDRKADKIFPLKIARYHLPFEEAICVNDQVWQSIFSMFSNCEPVFQIFSKIHWPDLQQMKKRLRKNIYEMPQAKQLKA